MLDVNSPGGFMLGGPEVADAVAAADKMKPVMAHVGGQGGSLAYWIASQAGEIIADRSSQVGSIGAYGAMIDQTERLKQLGVKVEVIRNKEGVFKAPGVMGTGLTDAQRSYLQGMIQAGFDEFRSAVKAKRPKIADEAMQGQVFNGTQGKAAGLVDRIGGMAYAMALLRQKVRANAPASVG